MIFIRCNSKEAEYPCQIADVCAGYKAALRYLESKKINTSKVIVSGPSAGAHLSSILCYSKSVQDAYDVDVSNVVGFIGVGGRTDRFFVCGRIS